MLYIIDEILSFRPYPEGKLGLGVLKMTTGRVLLCNKNNFLTIFFLSLSPPSPPPPSPHPVFPMVSIRLSSQHLRRFLAKLSG